MKLGFHKECYCKVEKFINKIIKLAKKKQYDKLIEFIDNFYERNETRLGYSIETTYGKSFGENGGKDFIKSISKSEIYEYGCVEDIFDLLIVVYNIGEDKVSDLITTIIFQDLIEYTQKQCDLWKIPTKNVSLDKKCWNSELEIWEKINTRLPIHSKRPIVFVPKSFVGKEYIFSYEKLYRELIIPEYKENELLKKDSKFVIKYKNGRVHVLGNELRKEYPCTKYVVLDFIKKYDNLYRQYKEKIL